MATQDDVRRIALALPGVVAEATGFAFNVAAAKKAKHIVWAWRERIHPKKSRVPSTKVVAIRVANELEKQALLSADEAKFFTEPHYDGYPAVLVNLDQVTVDELESLIREAWRCRAPEAATKVADDEVAPNTRRSPNKRAAPTRKSSTAGARRRPETATKTPSPNKKRSPNQRAARTKKSLTAVGRAVPETATKIPSPSKKPSPIKHAARTKKSR